MSCFGYILHITRDLVVYWIVVFWKACCLFCLAESVFQVLFRLNFPIISMLTCITLWLSWQYYFVWVCVSSNSVVTFAFSFSRVFSWLSMILPCFEAVCYCPGSHETLNCFSYSKSLSPISCSECSLPSVLTPSTISTMRSFTYRSEITFYCFFWFTEVINYFFILIR